MSNTSIKSAPSAEAKELDVTVVEIDGSTSEASTSGAPTIEHCGGCGGCGGCGHCHCGGCGHCHCGGCGGCGGCGRCGHCRCAVGA